MQREIDQKETHNKDFPPKNLTKNISFYTYLRSFKGQMIYIVTHRFITTTHYVRASCDIFQEFFTQDKSLLWMNEYYSLLRSF